MKLTGYYPVLAVRDVAASAAFYREHFGFEVAFEADWYVHLKHPDDVRVELAILDCTHETIPEQGRRPAAGTLLNFEVEDVDAVHARLVAAGQSIVRSLRDEDFGQRHFIVADPAGVLVDVITPIPPSGAFVEAYAAGS